MFRRRHLRAGDLVWIDRAGLESLLLADAGHRSSRRIARLLAATAGKASIVGRVVIVERDPRAYECRALFAEDDGPTLAVPVKIPDDARKLLRAMTSNEEATLPRAAIHPTRILTVEDD